jgi:alpha-ketoglutarate-dependent taurine dioxygenase
MAKSPLSILSLQDFNGAPLDGDLLERTFTSLINEHGYVHMCNIPDEFDHVGFCHKLGVFVPNYSGAIVGDVRPEPGMDDVYHAGNTRDLTPHTEGYDFTIPPPRYIALWCVTPCEGAGGETTLADAYVWLKSLSNTERDILQMRSYEWKTTEGIRRLGLELHAIHPVLEDTSLGMIVRFSCNNVIMNEDDPLIPLQASAKSFFDGNHIAVEYGQNDMLVWDNWRVLHSRNGFADRRRHLRRIQIAAGAA